MPDVISLLEVLRITAVAAAAAVLLSALPGRSPRPALVSLGGVLGVGAAFYLGCNLLGIRLRWSWGEDQDRLLCVVLPCALGVELIAACPQVPCGLAWALRLAVIAGVAPVLLHGSTYLTDLAGPGTREWTPAQAGWVLGGLAAALVAEWLLLVLLLRRAPGCSIPLALALTVAGASATVMLSGYLTGGQLGMPLAGALAGVSVAALALPELRRPEGALGVGLVGLFSLLVIGRFFGNLTTEHALLLFAAPLLGWVPEFPYLRRMPSWLRGFVRLVLAAAVVGVVVNEAQKVFVEKSHTPSSESREPTIQDYMDFRP